MMGQSSVQPLQNAGRHPEKWAAQISQKVPTQLIGFKLGVDRMCHDGSSCQILYVALFWFFCTALFYYCSRSGKIILNLSK